MKHLLLHLERDDVVVGVARQSEQARDFWWQELIRAGFPETKDLLDVSLCYNGSAALLHANVEFLEGMRYLLLPANNRRQERHLGQWQRCFL